MWSVSLAPMVPLPLLIGLAALKFNDLDQAGRMFDLDHVAVTTGPRRLDNSSVGRGNDKVAAFAVEKLESLILEVFKECLDFVLRDMV